MISRVALVDQVIEALQEDIAEGRLEPGARLPAEPELMRRLGVGRSTLREAVRVLAHGGMLEVRQGDGTYVRATTLAEPLPRRLRRATFQEVNEVRRMIEVEAARLAALRHGGDDLGQMRGHLDQRGARSHAGDMAGMVDADLAFHQAVVRAAHNGVLTDLFASFADVLRDTLTGIATDPDLHRDATDVHERLYEAIASGDPVAAAAVSEELLAGISERLGR